MLKAAPKVTLTTIAIGVLLACASSAHAGVITISTSDNQIVAGRDNMGYWRRNLMNAPNNDNYLASEFNEIRNYFSFDLSSVVGTVVSATLEVWRYSTNSGATLELFDVSTSAEDLAQRMIIDNNIHADLGTGKSYGSFVAPPGPPNALLSYALNTDALVDIQAALGGFFSVGGVSTGGVHFSGSSNEPGNSDQNNIQRLVLTVEDLSTEVPEPATIALFGIGLAGLGFARRRKTAA